MIKQAVSVIFDRRKNAPKKGYGMVELRIFISRNIYKYISLESCSQIDWNEVAFNEKYADMKTKYNNVLSAMKLLGVPMNMDTFNIYAGFNKEEKHDIDTQNTMHTENYTNVYADQKKNLLIQSCVMDSQPALYANDMNSFVYSDNKEHDISFYTNKYQLKCNDTNNQFQNNLYNTYGNESFISYMEESIKVEKIHHRTFQRKRTAIDLLRKFGRIRTFDDLTTKNIMDFDQWLRDGTRCDVTVFGYHKCIKMYVHKLYIAEMIRFNPYDRVKIKRGRNKEREPLTEDELLAIRNANLTGKLDRVRDLFIFSAYTELSYADAQLFDYKTMTEKLGDMYYIDGERVKTGSKYFTPILGPAMKVLKKYNYKLPRISNQKGNDYLHIIQDRLQIRRKNDFPRRTSQFRYDVPYQWLHD